MSHILYPKFNEYPKSFKFLGSKKFAERGGIIPYYIDKTVFPHTVYYLLGAKKIKKGYRWSDFGGGCKKKETVLECILREFLEESRGVVNMSITDITHIHIINKKKPYRVMLFVKLRHKDEKIIDIFDNHIPVSKAEEEIVKIRWFSEDEILKLPKKNTSKSVKEVIENGLINV